MPFKNFVIEEGESSDINTYLMRQMNIICTSSTRPSSPISGMRIFETDTLKDMVYDGSGWRLLSENPLIVQKQTTEAIASNTTPQDDDELFASVRANTDYIVTCVIFTFTDANVVGGFDSCGMKATFSGPASATMGWSTQAEHTGSTTTVNAGPISINYIGTISGVADVRTWGVFTRQLIFRGLLRVAGTAGTFRFRWSQSTSNASNLYVLGKASSGRTQSFLLLERVS